MPFPDSSIKQNHSTKIDEFLPKYDFSEKHSRLVDAKPAEAYNELQKIDFSNSFLIKTLFFLRGLKAVSFQQLQDNFSVLYKEPSKEIILGLIARPWSLKGGILKISNFTDFNEPNYAKMVWNFTFDQIDNKTLVSTETRILCTDEKSKRKFKMYWFFIGPCSGLIRSEMLRLLSKSLFK